MHRSRCGCRLVFVNVIAIRKCSAHAVHVKRTAGGQNLGEKRGALTLFTCQLRIRHLQSTLKGTRNRSKPKQGGFNGSPVSSCHRSLQRLEAMLEEQQPQDAIRLQTCKANDLLSNTRPLFIVEILVFLCRVACMGKQRWQQCVLCLRR
jgi:hypothetical protein